MTRIVYLNGDYIPDHEAKISIFDRAVNFGDAIYDVAGVLDGKLTTSNTTCSATSIP